MSAPIRDEAAEFAVLGAILVRNAVLDEIGDALEPEHFDLEQHRHIFRAMLALYHAGIAIDYITLRAELARTNHLDEATAFYVNTVGDRMPSSANAEHYAAIVRDKAISRRLRDQARVTIANAESGDTTGAALLEQTEAAVYGLGASVVKSEWISSPDHVRELRPMLSKIFEEGRAVTGVPTGFAELDFLTRGFQRADLILLGARPSQGKTAFGIQVAHHAASFVNVAFFSLEMSREGIGLRRVIQLADINGYRMLGGHSNELEQRRIGEAFLAMDGLGMWLDESPYINPLHLRSRLRRIKSQVGHIGLVVIDYLQLMAALPEDAHQNKTNQVAGISRMLKLLAREFGVPFLVLSQLHRVPENRRPTMADLRDSGALEQDADVVLLLHRPEVYEQTPENAGLAEVIIGKQRNGPTGIVDLTWRGESMRFENRSGR